MRLWLNGDDSSPNLLDTRDANDVQYARRLYATTQVSHCIVLFCVSNYRLYK